MPLQNPRDLFVYELRDIYDAEQKIVQMLQVMVQETQNPQVKSAFEQHENETKQQNSKSGSMFPGSGC